jgi:hypothetical protein
LNLGVPRLLFDFSANQSTSSLMTALLSVSRPANAASSNARALTLVDQVVYDIGHGSRNVRRVVVVMTDGSADQLVDVQLAADLVRSNNSTVVAFGVSSSTTLIMPELLAIGGTADNVYSLAVIESLTDESFDKTVILPYVCQLQPVVSTSTTISGNGSTTTSTSSTTTATTTSSTSSMTTPMRTTATTTLTTSSTSTIFCPFVDTDLIFVISASVMISDAEFTAELNFAANVVASLPIGPNNIRYVLVFRFLVRSPFDS